MGKFINKEVKDKVQSENDKDVIIADLMLENAELKQRVEDMEMIVSDMLGGN